MSRSSRLKSQSLARRIAAVGVVALLASGLAACGDEDGSTATSGKGLDSLTIGGDVGKELTVKWGGEIGVDKLESKTLVEGEGAEVKDGDIVMAHLWIGNGFTEEEAYSTYGEKTPQKLTVGEELAKGIKAAIEGHKIGSRVAVAAPPKDAFGDAGNPQLGIGNQDQVVFIVDLISEVDPPLKEPAGKAVPQPSDAPKIIWKKDVPTGFDFSAAARPGDKTRVIPVIKGTGKPVTAGQEITADYLGVTFGGKKPFDESYSKEPAAFPLKFPGGVIKGWVDGLTGQTIGSRVILVIPWKDAYGEAGQPPTIGKKADLVFVVDILGAA
ncbi:FKBP-type peptidyl-prolyl cis-trans isomerase [Nocardioides speluncae]|uniref:FKBP-type peptidyl-prolyl cis-trans isomerase n=1 Tax=Nocardioides speluncae TaxID=2670337 RepID=UPI000D69DB86|nr:FKBP-type peptidyl-prolyl cis-trans isomerase [Nocardioides speluncae]